jgi:hypothetical protein
MAGRKSLGGPGSGGMAGRKGLGTIGRDRHMGARVGPHHPSIALAIEIVIDLHAAASHAFGGDRYRYARAVFLKGHGRDLNSHRAHVQAGLRCARVQVLDHGAAHGFLVLNVFGAAPEQQSEQHGERGENTRPHDYDYSLRVVLTGILASA